MTINFITTYQKYILAFVFAMIFVWENILPQRYFSELSRHNTKNFLIGGINVILTFFLGIFFSQYLNWFNKNYHGLIQYMSIPLTYKIVVALVAADILMYWWHRLNHITFLWRFHSFHHEDLQMNSTTGMRFHVGELILSYVFRMIWYPLFGINSMLVLLFSTIHFSMIIFHHSNIRISATADKVLRWVITSPGMHRIHHSNKWKETNSNYTSILSCWDWIFRSYVHKPEGEINFGVPYTESGVQPRDAK